MKIQNIERTVAKKRQIFLCILPNLSLFRTRYGIFSVQNIAKYGHIGWCFPYFSLFSRIFPLPEKSALRRNVRYGIIRRLL